MKKLVVICLLAIFLLCGCAGMNQYAYQGAGLGAIVGGTAGALLDKSNHWRGGAIGAALGTLLGGGLTAISTNAANDITNQSRQGSLPTTGTDCRKVRERVFENNTMVKDTVREICDGRSVTNTY